MSVSDQTLLDYLIGVASSDVQRDVESQLADDPEVRTRLVALQNKSKAALPETIPSPSLRDRLLDSIDPSSRLTGYATRIAQLFDLSKERTNQLIEEIRVHPHAPWSVSTLAEVDTLHFHGGPNRTGAECGIVYMQSGVSFPRHDHEGIEIALVLAGECLDDHGQHFYPGDLCVKYPGEPHGYTSIGEDPLVQAVVHHGIRWNP